MRLDLTEGSPFKLLFKFSLPILIGNVFQQLYNMADTIIVGHTISSDAMSGVGCTASITFLILGLVWGLTSGFAVRKRNKKKHRSIFRAVYYYDNPSYGTGRTYDRPSSQSNENT